ncbi:hypothetical protein GP486_000712 [Trichoglossum hirsutum]|uniref:Uncharacterized protein n=1 Tax=Trichoglossum hirsutum TaxID=265104 RepID=A0A9P8LI18_9PEZI|nr:hypothetical protein GP486_000712 [Trichoglossum hirsutum]
MVLGSMADQLDEKTTVQSNVQTGRPIRDRQKVIRSGYVDTVKSLELVVAPEFVADSDSEGADPTHFTGPHSGRRKPVKPRKASLKQTAARPQIAPLFATLGIVDEPISPQRATQKPVVTVVSYTSEATPISIAWPSVKLAINVPAGQRFPILVDFDMQKLKSHIERGKVCRLKTTDQWATLNAEFGSTIRRDHLLSVEDLADVAGIRREISEDGSIYVDVDSLNNVASLNKDFRLVHPDVVIHTRGRASATPKGFLDLPAEIRNQIYSYLFLAEDRRIRFCGAGVPETHGGREVLVRHSSAFLRTCQQINAEGGAVLYGANEFIFERCFSIRGRWFESKWKQIGYEDVERFLTTIGMYNLSCLRSIVLYLDDGGIDQSTRDDRRFVYDRNLLCSFQILGTRCENLEALEIFLNPRRKICNKDVMFIESLKCIRNLKCLVFRDKHPHAVTRPIPYKIDEGVLRDLQRAMLCARAQLSINGLVTDERERGKLESRARYDQATQGLLFDQENWKLP